MKFVNVLSQILDLMMINRNMRCIEMRHWTALCNNDRAINRNMRCIEIFKKNMLDHMMLVINRNMRCIEMKFVYKVNLSFPDKP